MKITYIAKTVIPSTRANSIHIMKMCQAFGANKHYVKLLVPDFPPEVKRVQDAYAFYGVERNFDLIKLDWPELPGKSLWFGRNAAKRAAQDFTDLVYTRFLPGAYFAAARGIPVIFEAHDTLENIDGIQKFLFKRLLKSPSLGRIVVISEVLKKMLIEIYQIPGEKILVAHDGADIPIQKRIPNPAKADAGRLKVGYIGHLYPGRGMELIPEMAKAIKHADFHVIGGNDQDIQYWKEHTSDIRNIIFHGFLPPSEVEAYRNTLDIMLAPYQKKVTILGEGDTSRWMSPLKIFEYMASRKPMVVSDLPVLREVLNEKNAMLVEPDSKEAWIGAIRKLEDPQKRENLAERAFQDFLKHYTWTKRAQYVLSPDFSSPMRNPLCKSFGAEA